MRRQLSDIPPLLPLKERIAVKRSLLSLLLTLGALSACKDTPPGQLEPIPRPPGYVEPPKAEAASPSSAPAADPNKVTLRWKLAEGAPIAFRLEGTAESEAGSGLKTVYVLQRPETGDAIVRMAPEGRASAQDQGTISERGFILDGLGSIDRNVATLLLELPKNPVGPGDTWSLGADLVDAMPLGKSFSEKKSDRRNTVKLTALEPQGDDQVATLQYDLHERISGILSPALRALSGPGGDGHDHDKASEKTKGKGKGKNKGKDDEDSEPAKNPGEVNAEVTFTGRGEFLVKAGRWQSWEGTLSSKTEGYTPRSPDKAAVLVPPGTFKLRLTALEAVPAELLPAAAKK